MNETQHRFVRTVLWASATYFAACGLSAVFYPASWLFVSGLSTTMSAELELSFGALGSYLLTLACGAGISAMTPTKHPGLILVLGLGNLFDFCVTLKAVVAKQLPILNGGAFLAIAMAWAVLLGISYLYVKRAKTIP